MTPLRKLQRWIVFHWYKTSFYQRLDHYLLFLNQRPDMRVRFPSETQRELGRGGEEAPQRSIIKLRPD